MHAHDLRPQTSTAIYYCRWQSTIANANKDLGYFLEMVEGLGTRSQIGEGTSANLQAAFDAGMGSGNVPEILDYFRTLEN